MKKRLKKKIGNRYDLFKRAERQKRKRKGTRVLAYALVEIGESDKLKIEEEGYLIDFPYATHWFIEIVSSQTYYKNYFFQVYPCTIRGTSHDKYWSVIIPVEKKKDFTVIHKKFEKVVDDMKNDCFWDKDYVDLY